MSVNYWIDLFTGTTWDEFKRAGANVSGFRKRMQNVCSKVNPGDIFLCYLTGVMRWVGALEVIGPSNDKSKIWSDADFPVRFSVKPIVMMEAEFGVPMELLEGKTSFFQDEKDRGKFKGIVRGSPRILKKRDGDTVFELIKNAQENPIGREFDQKKHQRKPVFKVEQKRGKKSVEVEVTVPENEEEVIPSLKIPDSVAHLQPEHTLHTEIQFLLISLAGEMGFEAWIARNDKGKSWNGKQAADFPHVVMELPTQFNEATTKTIEMIDVLWLKGNSIIAAFEVECTTAIYSGLLRMSDLLALQPNLNIKLYLVAPEERKNKVYQEILRPSFSLREPPLPKICGFIELNKLKQKIQTIRELGLAASLKPDFLEQDAEYFTGNEK